MKHFVLVLAAVACSWGMSAETMYFDFGGSGSRGTLTVNPDANGHHWNNITPATSGATSIAAKTAFDALVDAEGNTTGISLILCNAWGVNGNSGGGGLYNPSPDLLGDLAVESATVDYMFNTNNGDGGRSFVIRGLDKSKGYKFTIFGSRSASDVREGLYTLTGTNGWATMMRVAGAGIGHNAENQNTDNAPQSDIIYPDASGNITMYIHHEATTYIPISCMKMEAVESTYTRDGDISRTLLFDFGSNGSNTARGNITTITGWNNISNNDGNYCAAATTFTDFVDTAGAPTDITLTVNHRFSTNGGSGGGGLSSPDAALLGDLAVATATNDYFYTETGETNRTMTFSGLDPKKAYRFYIFGTRSNAECRLGLYHFEGINDSYGAQQVAGNAFSSAASQNTANILESNPIFPTADGSITITLINNAKTYVALSAMKIEELGGIERPDIKSYISATLGGDAVAAGEVTTLTANDRANWQVWAKLNPGEASITAVDEFGVAKEFAFTVPAGGIYRVDANLDEDTATLFECTYFCVEGSAVGGWNTTGIELAYIGQGRWHYKGALKGYDKSTDNGRVNFIMNKSWSYQYKRVAGSSSKLVLSDGEDIPLNPGTYDITVDLNAMTWNIANGLDTLDPYRITVMGSSVSNGQGATDNEGYAHMYNLMLADRHSNSLSEYPFYISNIAVNGNSSVNLLNRYDDLEREYGKYVIYAISLGNEGIHEATDKPDTYNRFLTNMQTLIAKAREDGKIPMVMNNYTRTDFTDADYGYIKDMNAEIAFWDVPSVNMLGAIDDGAGHWAPGYDISTDIYHPNTDGHREFFYAMVPSMYDALESGKELTMNRVVVTEPYALPAGNVINFTPESTVHSFTLALSAKPAANTLLLAISGENNTSLALRFADGNYNLQLNGETVATVASSGALDNIVITQNYAAKRLALIVNNVSSNMIAAEFVPTSVQIGNKHHTESSVLSIGELMWYRSSMFTHNPFADSRLFKSSLEIYTPFVGSRSTTLPNYAMSTNVAIQLDNIDTSVNEVESDKDMSVIGLDKSIRIATSSPKEVVVANLAGIVIARLNVDGIATIDNLHPGVYIVNNDKALVK